jgi:hypothetical protein
MGIEFVINKELANIGMTLTEFSSVTRIINDEIGPGQFSDLFNTMMGRMANAYDVVVDNLQPFIDLDTEEAFVAGFDALVSKFKDNYLLEISKSRTLTVDAYDDYEHLVCMREAKTRFPLLKRTFTRLAELTDKWIANDYWLAMSIDTLCKMLPRLLTEIAELKQKDPGDAYQIYSAAFSDFDIHLALIKQQNARFHESIRQPAAAAVAS